MPHYNYAARDLTGKHVKGTIQAADERAAGDALREIGYFVTNMEVSRDVGLYFKELRQRMGRVSLMEIASFARQFATMIGAGISLIPSLRILEQQTDNRLLQSALGNVSSAVTRGETLAGSMAQHRKVFPDIVPELITAGEVSGSLDAVLDRLAEYLEREHVLNEKVRTALYYPTIVLAVMIIGFNFLMYFVMPSFIELFSSFDMNLPVTTRLVIWFSKFFRNNFFLLTGLSILGLFMLHRYYKTPQGKKRTELFLFNLPIIGQLFLKKEVAKFCLTLGTLVKSGVPLITALNVAEKTTGNSVIAEAIAQAQASVRRGGGIARPLQATGLFPPMVPQMIRVGEETGKLEEMLEKIGTFYSTDAMRLAERMTSLIEPVLIIVLGVGVAVIVTSIYMPLFEMMNIE